MAKGSTIDGATFRECLSLMGWSHAEAARQLGIHSRKRVGDWASGIRPVPAYIARSLAFRVDAFLAKKGL